MRTITGLLAILLGFVGVMACAAGSGLVWWGTFALAGQVDQLATRADESLATVDDALTRMSGKVESTASVVGRVRASAAALDTEAATKAQVSRLLDELSPQLERADVLADSLRSLGTVLRNIADVTAGLDDRGPHSARLRSAADKLGGAAGTLGSAGDRVAALRQGDVPPRARELVRLADQAKATLDQLGGGLADVRHATEDVRGELPEVRRAASAWKLAGPAIATAVLIWVGLGQLCLIGWGRRRLARPTAPPPPTRA